MTTQNSNKFKNNDLNEVLFEYSQVDIFSDILKKIKAMTQSLKLKSSIKNKVDFNNIKSQPKII